MKPTSEALNSKPPTSTMEYWLIVTFKDIQDTPPEINIASENTPPQ